MFFVRQNYVFCLLKFNAYRMNLVQASQNNRKRPKIRKKKKLTGKRISVIRRLRVTETSKYYLGSSKISHKLSLSLTTGNNS